MHSNPKEHSHPESHSNRDTGPHQPHPQQPPYWQRAHKDKKFWVGVVAIFAAVTIYICTLDLSTVPWPWR